MDEKPVIKCVVVGDGYVGKTCLLTRISKKEINATTGYLPTVFDNSSVEVEHNGTSYELHLFDTAGQEDFSEIRQFSYDNADIFLLCFSVTNMNSFIHIKEVWIPEISNRSHKAKMILVGTKSDLRKDPDTIDEMNIRNEVFVSITSAEAFAKDLNVKYVECSAITKENIDDLVKIILEENLAKNIERPMCFRAHTTLKRIFCFWN